MVIHVHPLFFHRHQTAHIRDKVAAVLVVAGAVVEPTHLVARLPNGSSSPPLRRNFCANPFIRPPLSALAVCVHAPNSRQSASMMRPSMTTRSVSSVTAAISCGAVLITRLPSSTPPFLRRVERGLSASRTCACHRILCQSTGSGSAAPQCGRCRFRRGERRYSPFPFRPQRNGQPYAARFRLQKLLNLMRRAFLLTAQGYLPAPVMISTCSAVIAWSFGTNLY